MAKQELADFLTLVQRQQALLDELTPIPETDARALFARLGIDEPNRYEDAVTAFSSFRQYAMTAEGASVEVVYLKRIDASSGNDVLYVHLDDVPELGFVVCRLVEGGFLGRYKTGSGLREALGIW
ncbi:MAG TPA: hypothetical protein VF097_06260 [Actinomycetota bacterium]